MDSHRTLVLDMDGVVNSDAAAERWMSGRMAELRSLMPSQSEERLRERAVGDIMRCLPRDEMVFPELAALVSSIAERTGCSIVWSSDWRRMPRYRNLDNARAMFDSRGLPGAALSGIVTPLDRSVFLRGDEIRMWLADAGYDPSCDRVAVLDDLDEAGMGLPEGVLFLRTDPRVGVTMEQADMAVEFLKR